jgi:ABC-2 type transport system ATP-binding protein
MVMDIAVKVENVTKTYDAVKAVDGLSVEFPAGKVTGLLGPNGAGKSTLFKMMMNLARPESGKVSIFGQNPSVGLNADIAYLPDRIRWYKFHTVREAISYAGTLLPNFEIQRANAMAATMQLEPDIKVGTLSRGKQACLNLIFCLARNTRLVLLDEPFSGIDLIARERIVQGIIDLALNQNQTIIISTHEIYDAESLFEYVVFINEGKAVLTGEAEVLRAREGSLESIYRRLFR